MDRRAFVGRSAGLLIPAWLALAFGCRQKPQANAPSAVAGDAHASDLDLPGAAPIPPRTDDPVANLRRLRAAADVPPILAIVVPDEPRYANGGGATLWGGLIHLGGPDVVLRLGACAVECATREEIAAGLGVDPGPRSTMRGELLGVVMGPERASVSAIRLESSLVSPSRSASRDEFEGLVQRRLDAFEARVQDALARAIPEVPGGDPEATRRALTAHPPSGALWAVNEGCGLIVPGVRDTSGWLCGMGSVPVEGRNFLWFLGRE